MLSTKNYKFLVAASDIQLDVFGTQFDFASAFVISEEVDDITAIQSTGELLNILNVAATPQYSILHYPTIKEQHEAFGEFVPEMAALFLTDDDNIVGKVLGSEVPNRFPGELSLTDSLKFGKPETVH